MKAVGFVVAAVLLSSCSSGAVGERGGELVVGRVDFFAGVDVKPCGAVRVGSKRWLGAAHCVFGAQAISAYVTADDQVESLGGPVSPPEFFESGGANGSDIVLFEAEVPEVSVRLRGRGGAVMVLSSGTQIPLGKVECSAADLGSGWLCFALEGHELVAGDSGSPVFDVAEGVILGVASRTDGPDRTVVAVAPLGPSCGWLVDVLGADVSNASIDC